MALSNLADIEQRRGASQRAQELFRRVLSVYAEVLDKTHPLQGIGRIRFGHALLAAGQTADAEAQSRAGYDLMVERSDPPAVWMTMARQDLATAYRSLGRPAEAERFQAELATAAGNAQR